MKTIISREVLIILLFFLTSCATVDTNSDFPAYIVKLSNPMTLSHCTGFLISPTEVLTAGHCYGMTVLTSQTHSFNALDASMFKRAGVNDEGLYVDIGMYKLRNSFYVKDYAEIGDTLDPAIPVDAIGYSSIHAVNKKVIYFFQEVESKIILQVDREYLFSSPQAKFKSLDIYSTFENSKNYGLYRGASGGPLVQGGKVVGIISAGEIGQNLYNPFMRVIYSPQIHEIKEFIEKARKDENS